MQISRSANLVWLSLRVTFTDFVTSTRLYLRMYACFSILFTPVIELLLLYFVLDLNSCHREVMGAVKSQLETSHQEDLNDITARYLAETAIKVETTRLETEHEWQEKFDEMKEKHELELKTMAEKLTQVSTASFFFFCKIAKFCMQLCL